MADDLKTQLGGLWRRALKGAETLGAEIQRNAPGAIEQMRGHADAALATVTKRLEDVARAAEEAGILQGRRPPDDGEGRTGESVRETQFGRPSGSAEREHQPGARVFELGAPGTRITARLSEVGADTLHAVVSHPLWPPVRLRVQRADDGYSGSGATNDGTPVKLIIDSEGKCTASFGTHAAVMAPPADHAESFRVRFGVNRERELATRLASLLEGPISENQRAALTSLAGGEVSKRGGSVKLAELIAAKDTLTAAQAAQTPLLHAWVASDESFDADRLTALLAAALRSPAVSPAARAVAESAIEASRKLPPGAHPESAWAVVLTGLLGAVSMLEREASDPMAVFHALVDGAGTALRLVNDGNAGRPECVAIQAQSWAAVTQLMCRSLPVGPLRAGLANVINQTRALAPDAACRVFSSALADTLRLARGGAKSAESSRGLPLLHVSHTVAPVHVRRFAETPLGATSASWRDVAQRESFLDCSHASAWIAMVAMRSDIVGRLIRELPGEPRRFALTAYFPEAGGGFRSEAFELDDRLYASDNGEPVFGTSRLGEAAAPASLWYALAEKGFAQVRGDPNYASCEFCLPTDVWQMALGTRAIHEMSLALMRPEEIAAQLKAARAAGSPMVLGTHQDLAHFTGSDLAGAHAYAVIDVVERDGQTFVQLVNPRGATAPLAPGLAGEAHLAAVDLELRYGQRNEIRGLIELPVERVAREFTQCFWVSGEALAPAAG